MGTIPYNQNVVYYEYIDTLYFIIGGAYGLRQKIFEKSERM